MKRTWDPTFLAMTTAAAMLAGSLAFTGGLGPGEWKAKPSRGKEPIRFDLRLDRADGDTHVGIDIDGAQLEGYDAAAFGRSGAPLRFAWKREPGTFRFDGEGGRSARGHVQFEPDPAFAAQWQALGFQAPDGDEMLRLAVHGIRVGDAAKLRELGYGDLDADDLIRLDPSAETLEWAEAMRAFDAEHDFAELLRLRSHGVSAEEAKEFAALGLPQVRVDDYLRLRGHGVEPDYLRDLKETGFELGDLDGVVRLAQRGIEPAYVGGIRTSGLRETGVDAIVRLHEHGIGSDYVRDVVATGLPDAATDSIVRLHAHGVTPVLVRTIVASCPAARSTDAIVLLHDHGLDEDWIREMAGLGFRDARPEDLARLSAHGVTPELVRSLADAGYRDLTVERLIRAASQGPESLGKPAATRREAGDTRVE